MLLNDNENWDNENKLKMKERYKVYLVKGIENGEYFPYGIIDKERDNKCIRNYNSICKLLNTYNYLYEHLINEMNLLKEVTRFQKELIHALEEIVILKED